MLRFSIVLSLLVASPAAVCAETRVALVVGNSAYRAIPALTNPRNDAMDIAMTLGNLGFKVTALVDLDQASMERAIADFARDAEGAAASVFYFGGHGLQVEGHNFLLPIDFQLSDRDDIYGHAVPLDEVLKELEQGAGVHLVFLDACRTNPLKNAHTFARTEGLARVGDAAGFLISFATQPGNITFDGAGRNSPYAEALLARLPTVGQSVSNMMIDVRKDVIRMTAGSQIPWENSSLTRRFYFVPGEAETEQFGILSWQTLPFDFGDDGVGKGKKGHKGAPGHGNGHGHGHGHG